MRNLPHDNAHTPVRRCILTGERAPQAALIRLALGPENMVAPDLRGKAPGRGAWLAVDRASLEAACAKGKLGAALGRAYKSGGIKVPEGLAEAIEQGLERATLDRLGLEARAGMLISGADRIASAARRGAVSLLLHASDAGADGRDRLDRMVGGERGIVLPVGRDRLSAALGRQNSVHAALIDAAAAARVERHLARWLKFIGCGN